LRAHTQFSYCSRYIIIKKLGWGHFSTVWMVRDRQQSSETGTSTLYALKVQKSAKHYTEAAIDEIELLNCIAKERDQADNILKTTDKMAKDSDGVFIYDNQERAKHIATLHNSFFHTGPNGKHMCMVFSMLGCNLLSVIKAYNYRGIPIPAVKTMVKGIAMGLDFLHRKCLIIHTDLKPENVLLQFYSQAEMDAASIGTASTLDEDDTQLDTEQLEALLKDPKTPTEERKSLRKKLKRRRQKEKQKFRNPFTDSKNSHEFSQVKNTPPQTLSDEALELYLNENTRQRVSQSQHLSAERQPSRLALHSSFVSTNFDQYPTNIYNDLSHTIDEKTKISRSSKPELAAYFHVCSLQSNSHKSNHSGVAEVMFMLRAYIPESEIADLVSAALGGIPWEKSDEKNATREWRCALTMERNAQPSISTIFKLVQSCRTDTHTGVRKFLAQLIDQVGDNITGGELENAHTANGDPNTSRSMAYSLFSVKFSVLSTMVVLGFLENRFPGLLFCTYKRDDGRPRIDDIVFGPYSQSICNHPLTMKMRDINETAPLANINASSIFGFDLRLVKAFAARPMIDGNGTPTFRLNNQSSDKVSQWWACRHSINDRVKMFMGLEPKVDFLEMTLSGHRTKSTTSNQVGQFLEGEKRAGGSTLTTSGNNRITFDSPYKDIEGDLHHQPDLKDLDVLKRSRAVVVDLGNACWTHKHFSEDIQTRQYRAPEVIIGNK